MKDAFTYSDSSFPIRAYVGCEWEEGEVKSVLAGQVSQWMRDQEAIDWVRDEFEATATSTGFPVMTDLQDSLLNTPIPTDSWRIGEALAHHVMATHFHALFIWNPLRDMRNPFGSATGADLVGFIRLNEVWYFLFGEIKTSSEASRPPQVMAGMRQQLSDLDTSTTQRGSLVKYLGMRVNGLLPDSPGKTAWSGAKITYLQQRYHLAGVLVRAGLSSDKRDVENTYRKLHGSLSAVAALQLIALYIPEPESSWSGMLNLPKS